MKGKSMNVNKRDYIMANAFKSLLTIQIISSLTTFIGPLVDGLIISNFYGSLGIASFGIANPITIIISAIANIFMAGSQAVSGRYLGKGNSSAINQLMTNVIVCASIVGAVILVILTFGATPIADLLGATDETLQWSSDYIRALCIGAIPMIISPALVGYLQIDRCGKLVVISTVVMTVTDVVLDLLNALVINGGMFGMGLATTISYYVAVIIVLQHFIRGKGTLHFIKKEKLTKDIKSCLTSGLPSAVFLICNTVRVSVLNIILVGLAGTTAVAIFSIQNTLRPLTVGFTIGTGVTTLLVCSVIAGEGNRRSLRKELGYILKFAFILSIVVGVLVFVLAKFPLAKLFCLSQPDEFTNAVALTLRLYAISIPFCMINSVFTYYYQSMRRIVLATVICVLDNAVFTICASLLLGNMMGTTGVWLSYMAAETLTLIIIFVYTAIVNKKLPRNVHDYLLLPAGFGVQAEDRLNITAESKEDVVGLSKDIVKFCTDHGLNKRTSMAAALCCEELSVIAIENGKGRKNTYVDIYATFVNGSLSLRIRDNSLPFDAKLLSGAVDENDPAANIGIRLVKGLAKDMSYNVVLGLNVFSLNI